MSYFPFFVELSDKRGLIVGGGTVALRKVQKLLPYGPTLMVVAPEIGEALRTTEGLLLRERRFAQEDLMDADFVIAATDDHGLNRRVAELCKARRIPVNVADCKEACTFLFPALVKRGELSVGISTGGASPTAAVYCKDRFEELLPENFGEILAYLETARETARETLTEETQRKKWLAGLFADCLRLGRPLTDAALAERLRAAQEEAR